MPEIIIKLGDQIVQKYYLYKDSVTIGRAPENEISIENLAVSRRHAEILRENGSYVLEDLNSANGTFVNGVQVTRTEIVDKDVISIGKHKLYFYNQQAAPLQMVEKTMLVTRPAQTKAMLRVTRGKQKDQVFELTKVENRIGRASDNEIRLGDWFVSKHHAEVIRKGLVYVVRDLASWRHTMVNGQVVEEQVLKPGDEIQFGPKIAMVFEVADGTAAREGSGRKPIELEGVDKPLPIAGGDPSTPLPIAGSTSPAGAHLSSGAREGGQSSSYGAHANGSNDPQLDEGWEDEPAVDALDDLSPGEFAPDDDSVDEPPRVRKDDDSGFDVAPVRLEVEEESGAGWDEAGSHADQRARVFDAGSPRAEAPDSWSPRSADAFSDTDSAGLAGADREELRQEGDAGEEAVATFDSERVESAPYPDEGDEREPVEVESREHLEIAEASQGSIGSDFVPQDGGGSASEGGFAAHSGAESSGVAGGAEPAEVEMWLQALRNPSKIIRKQAQRQLQRLTGQVYDIEP